MKPALNGKCERCGAKVWLFLSPLYWSDRQTGVDGSGNHRRHRCPPEVPERG